ncbi:MAG: hypothetical protein RLZZ241_1906 [Bacteroidota bacterium]
MGEPRQLIAKRAAQEVAKGMIVNLGIGIPSLIPDFLDADMQVFFHSENGLLGFGPTPIGMPDWTLSNAAGLPVSMQAGASFFDSTVSFGMIRNGRIDLAVLGSLQVSAAGDLANWIVPGKRVPGVGGAMELAYGAKRLIALMQHCEKSGKPKLVQNCDLPLTATRCVKRVITDMGVFDIDADGFTLVELMPGVSLRDIQNHTEADFKISSGL